MSPVISAGLSPLRSTLENGMVVLAKQTSAAPAVTIHAMIHAGTVHDPVGLPGVAHFAAKVLDRGTVMRSAGDIADALDERGVSLSIKAGRHTTGLSVDCLSEDVEGILELVAEIIRHPSFPEDQVGLRRREIITRLKQDEDNPGARVVQAVFPLMYGTGHPYSWPGKGTQAYGFVTITRTDPSYYAWWVMNMVLGQYGIGGRIGDDVRERQGLAYYAFSSLDPHAVPGPLLVRAGVDGANVDRAIATIDAQVARMAAEGPTEEEIADTKHYLIGSLPRTLETNAGIAFFLQAAEHFGLGLDYDLRLPGLIDAVSRDAAHEAASQLDPNIAAIAIAGPYPGATSLAA
jgi:predicted Zn-dependent peptidase